MHHAYGKQDKGILDIWACNKLVCFFVCGRQLPRLFDRFKSAEGFLFVQDDMILNYWNLVQADKNKLWITDKVLTITMFDFIL